MPYMIDIARKFAEALNLKNESSTADSGDTVQLISISSSLDSVSPATVSSAGRRKARPPPIDISLAHQNRALQQLPHIKTPVSVTSEYSPFTPYESPRGTPIYVHIYAQLRSPGSSTPFPSGLDTPQKALMPVTAVSGPFTPSPPFTATKRNTFCRMGTMARQSPSPAVPPTAFITQTGPATYPFARSKRLERMLATLIDPIETDTSSFTVNSRWYRARTPIAGWWELFRRPSQVRLARLAEAAWYGGDEAGYDDPEEEPELIMDGSSGNEGSSSGWSGLPSPISPLFV